MRERWRQLHRLSRATFRAPTFVDVHGTLHTRAAENVPLVRWPDGSWCHSANTFVREQFEKNLSRRLRGGSLAATVADLSHLLRFCWQRRLDPIDLTDTHFSEFVTNLVVERAGRGRGGRARSERRVCAIARSCLQYLASVADHADDAMLLGKHGRIRAVVIQSPSIRTGSGRPRGPAYRTWHHPAIPMPGPLRRRLAVATASITMLREAVSVCASSPHQRARRHVLIKLLEVTGARRGEIAELTVDAVLQARQMTPPMLRLVTLKKRGDAPSIRHVPISPSDLAFVWNYIEFYRNPVLRRRRKGRPDHGIVLVSEATGEALKPTSLTQEIRTLAKVAGIAESICPHQFRHRFITKLFATLIEQHAVQNPDEFRRLLLDSETLKLKVAEWTGHTSTESLNRYIDLAFAEAANLGRSYDLARVMLSVESFLGSVEAEIQGLEVETPARNSAMRIRELAMLLKRDLDAACVGACRTPK